ncbi:MAG: 50S ribosomal protein L13 [Puniceicoccales bacterium]|jgi:large subunit ribosomal protein L13|nr:50S ribosomal protein L13 [Puniceicoccales bacterium]
MSTTLATAKDIENKRWLLLDANGKVLGRLAVKIANILRGRDKPLYTPHMDTGDFVIVINAEKVRLTGNKNNNKEYMFYSGYQGGEKYVPVSRMREKRSEFLIENAVRGMLPKNKLSRKLITKLKVYKGDKHLHASQQPVVVNINE